MLVEVWGAREGGLDEKQLPQDGGVWIEGGLRGQPPLCNSAVLKARVVLEAWGAGGSKSALTRPCFILPIRVRTDRGFQVRQALTSATSVSSPMMTDKTATSFC